MNRTFLNDECRSRFNSAALIQPEKSGDKNLVYTVVGRDENYMEMLRLLLKSIKQHTKNQQFDFLVICDEHFSNLFGQMAGFEDNFYGFCKPNIADPYEFARAFKWAIVDYPEIQNYEKVLFLDCDILINQDLNRIFEHELKDNAIYGVSEEGSRFNHRHIYFGLSAYTSEDLRKMQKAEIQTMNSGQFLFLNTPAMRQHIDNIRWLQRSWPFEQFSEQSAFNHYFNLNLASDTKLLAEHFTINVDRSVPFDRTKNVHFAGNMGCSDEKIKTMLRFSSAQPRLASLSTEYLPESKRPFF